MSYWPTDYFDQTDYCSTCAVGQPGIQRYKFFAIFLRIADFVAVGLEHSVAKIYLPPFGWFVVLFAGADFWQAAATAAAVYPAIGLAGLVHNLVSVTLGNIVRVDAVALLYGMASPQKTLRAVAVIAPGR